MIYVVIETGYEGIEGIIWAGEDIEDAKQHVAESRESVEKRNDWRNKDPDFICVMRPGGDGYECCCDELAVNPSKTMLRERRSEVGRGRSSAERAMLIRAQRTMRRILGDDWQERTYG